jgi:hypothetical protein
VIAELMAGVFIVAVIYILVRPSSKGTAFVTAFGSFMSAIIGQATDLATSDSSGTTTSGN